MAADSFAEMMSNSTLPLGFLHSINRPHLFRVAVGLNFDILRQCELGRILDSGCCNKIDQFHNLSADFGHWLSLLTLGNGQVCFSFLLLSCNLHLVVRMNISSEFHPITHLLPGRRERSFVVKVHTVERFSNNIKYRQNILLLLKKCLIFVLDKSVCKLK